MLPTLATATAALLVFGAIGDVGQAILLASAILAALIYIAKQVRNAVRKADEILTELPERTGALERKVTEQNEQHEAAHAEMLSMVTRVSAQVGEVGERLEKLEGRAADEHEHVQALTRELDVPVRRPRDAA